jgi:hypothetical protein
VKAIQWDIQNEDCALDVLRNFDAYENNFDEGRWKWFVMLPYYQNSSLLAK